VLAMRSFPYLIPRLARPFHQNPLGCASDAYTSHLRHDLLIVPLGHYRRFVHLLNRLMCTLAALLFLAFPWLGRDKGSGGLDAFNQDAAAGFLDKDTTYSNATASLIYAWCNWSGQGERGQKFACKNVMFVDNVAKGKIRTNVSGIERLEGDRVHFTDGSSARCDRLILCTGYRDVFPFLKGTLDAESTPLEVPEGNVRRLYKHVSHLVLPFSLPAPALLTLFYMLRL